MSRFILRKSKKYLHVLHIPTRHLSIQSWHVSCSPLILYRGEFPGRTLFFVSIRGILGALLGTFYARDCLWHRDCKGKSIYDFIRRAFIRFFASPISHALESGPELQ